MRTSDAETKWLPLTVNTVPWSTSEKLTVLGDSDPITGAGRALPQRGLRVLLHPRKKATESGAARESTGGHTKTLDRGSVPRLERRAVRLHTPKLRVLSLLNTEKQEMLRRVQSRFSARTYTISKGFGTFVSNQQFRPLSKTTPFTRLYSGTKALGGAPALKSRA
jgi:hypothetical protein